MYANLIKIPNNLIIMLAFFLTTIFTPITCGMCHFFACFRNLSHQKCKKQ